VHTVHYVIVCIYYLGVHVPIQPLAVIPLIEWLAQQYKCSIKPTKND